MRVSVMVAAFTRRDGTVDWAWDGWPDRPELTSDERAAVRDEACRRAREYRASGGRGGVYFWHTWERLPPRVGPYR